MTDRSATRDRIRALDGLRAVSTYLLIFAHFLTVRRPPSGLGEHVAQVGPLWLGELSADVLLAASGLLAARALRPSRAGGEGAKAGATGFRAASAFLARRSPSVAGVWVLLAVTSVWLPGLAIHVPPLELGDLAWHACLASNWLALVRGSAEHHVDHLGLPAAVAQCVLLVAVATAVAGRRGAVALSALGLCASMALRLAWPTDSAAPLLVAGSPARLDAFFIAAIAAGRAWKATSTVGLLGGGALTAHALLSVVDVPPGSPLALAALAAAPFVRATGAAALVLAITDRDRGTAVVGSAFAVGVSPYAFVAYLSHRAVYHAFAWLAPGYHPGLLVQLPWPALYLQAATMVVCTLTIGSIAHHAAVGPAAAALTAARRRAHARATGEEAATGRSEDPSRAR